MPVFSGVAIYVNEKGKETDFSGPLLVLAKDESEARTKIAVELAPTIKQFTERKDVTLTAHVVAKELFR